MAASVLAQSPQAIHDRLKCKTSCEEEQWGEYFRREDVSLDILQDILSDAMGIEEYERFIESVKEKHEYKKKPKEFREEVVLKVNEVAGRYLDFLYDTRHSRYANNYRDTFHTKEESLNCLYADSLSLYFQEENHYEYIYRSIVDAAKKGLNLIIQVLIDLDKVIPEFLGTILQKAAKNGHESIVRQILYIVVSKDIKLHESKLHKASTKAAHYGHLPVIEIMLKRGFLSQQSYNLCLLEAVYYNHRLIVDLLLDNPLSKDIITQENFDLAIAGATIKDENYLILRQLLQYAKVNYFSINMLDVIFYDAACGNRVNIVRELLSDPIVSNNISDSTFDEALLNPKTSCVEIVDLILHEQLLREIPKKRPLNDEYQQEKKKCKIEGK